MYIKHLIAVVVIIATAEVTALAQPRPLPIPPQNPQRTRSIQSRGDVARPRFVVDLPTGEVLDRASFDVRTRFAGDGAMIIGASVGLSDRLMIQVTYGGTNVLGTGVAQWNVNTGVGFRYLAFGGPAEASPTLVFGFDNQGHGDWNDKLGRYKYKSPGFFVTGSTTYPILFRQNFGVHAGINYSLERGDGDDDPNIFVGIDLEFNPELAFLAEYNFGLNDNDNAALKTGKDLLNIGLRWTVTRQPFPAGLRLEFLLRDVANGKDMFNDSVREFRLVYTDTFL